MLQYLLEYNRYLCFFGIGSVLLLAWSFSRARRQIDYRLVCNALLLQIAIAFILLRVCNGAAQAGGGLHFFAILIQNLYGFAGQGISFLFGNLADMSGSWGFIFAIKVLPIIVFFGALMSVLFYLGLIQKVVNGIGWLVRPILGTSGAETLCAVANSFLGQTEAPLLIRHYLAKMSKSEIFVVMVSGMTTVSGAIMAVYAAMGVAPQHMLVASLMAIPGAILIAKIIYPQPKDHASNVMQAEAERVGRASNIFDAIAAGTTDGLGLAMNVGAMLVVFISLMALLNAILVGMGSFLNYSFAWNLPSLNLNLIFGYLFYPFAYLMGFEGNQAYLAADLLGTKLTINELVAFSKMVQMPELTTRAQAVLTYALCGFSNFSCIGIQVGGIGALVPEKRSWLTELGLLTVFASSLANLLSAFIVAILI